MIKKVSRCMEDVEVDTHLLNGWPKGTVGYEVEEEFIKACCDFADTHGFGRMQQIANDIHKIVDGKEGIIEYLEKYKECRFKKLGWPTNE